MFYQSDFRTLPARFQPRYDYQKSFRTLRKGQTKLNAVSPLSVEDEEERNILKSWFYNFCSNTSIHGVRFIGQRELHWSERVVWSFLVLTAIASVISISLELSDKFSSSPLSTVVESTIFPVAEIAYPAITLCNQNRFHRRRCEEAEKKFLPDADDETLASFRVLVLSLNQLEFGALDEFYEELFNFTSPELNSLNLTEIFDFVMLRCEEIFVGKCWWRNKYVDCCHEGGLFFRQRTEYGLCYSFNSAVSAIGKEKDENASIHYPLRTSNYGDWSGLRIEMSTRTDIAIDEDVDGVVVIVQHPSQWPNDGRFVPPGSQTAVVIKPTYSYTTEDVRRLTPDQRQCLNEDESKAALTLPGLKYLQMNCISECRQQYIHKYCNCTVETFFPEGSYNACNFEDLKCLLKFNDVFNYEKPPDGNPFFNDQDDGMECPCLPECNRVEYATEVATNVMPNGGDNMTVDFHFQSASIVKYRTDVTFGWLDLMVSFGGIAGLFLGCSILSSVEIVYYVSLLGLMVCRKLKKKFDKFLVTNSRQARVNKNHKKPRKNLDSIRVIKIQTLAEIDKNLKFSLRNNKQARY